MEYKNAANAVAYDDRGRVLAGLDGIQLANDPGNLRFTNADLNLNKSDMTVEEYIQWCEDNPTKVNRGGAKGEPLTEEVKDALRKEYNRAKKEYDAKLTKAYYTSPQFAKYTAAAASKRGVEMGLRQALGFIFVEIWMCTKEELQAGRVLLFKLKHFMVCRMSLRKSARRDYRRMR